MDYEIWKRSKRIENEFLRSLEKLCNTFVKIAKATGSDQQKYVNAMHNFQNSIEYERYITSAVKRMVTPLGISNQRTWRMAVKKAAKGKILYRSLVEELRQSGYRIMEGQIIENANLIKTLPEDVASKVVVDIVEHALQGKRSESIERLIIDKTDQHSRASARLIARTEVSKTSTALTKARSEQLGIQWYIWRTALDGNKVRISHQIMEGVLVNWNDPPSPEALAGEKSVGYYHAGNIWNCRCYPEPLIDIDDVHWPHKVYTNGKIITMKKGDFLQLL